MNESCLNNLNDVYKQYCQDAEPLEKHLREVFVTGTVDDVLQNFQVTSVITTILKSLFLGTCPKDYFWGPKSISLTILLLIIKYQKVK